MPSNIIWSVKQTYPKFKDVPDDELTLRYAEMYPEYLEDKEFREDHERIIASRIQPEVVTAHKKPEAGAVESFGRRLAGGHQALGGSLWKGSEYLARLLGVEGAANEFKENYEYARAYADFQRAKSAKSGLAGFAGTVGEAIPSLLPVFATAGAGMPIMATAAGATGGLSTLGRAEDAYTQRNRKLGMSESDAASDARLSALAPAALSALATGLITRGFGATGVEALAGGRAIGAAGASAASQAGNAELRAIVSSKLAPMMIKGAGREALEEATDQVFQSAIEKLSYNPELTLADAIHQVFMAGAVGGVLGGTVAPGVGLLNKKSAKEYLEAEDARLNKPRLMLGAGERFNLLPFSDTPLIERTGKQGVMVDAPVDSAPPLMLGSGETLNLLPFSDTPLIERTGSESAMVDAPVESAPPVTKTSTDFKTPGVFYRVVHGVAPFVDLVESGEVKTDHSTKIAPGLSMAEKLTARPTAFPSFTKGAAQMSYAKKDPNHYIYQTTSPLMKPSSSGRHSVGRTMFPTDASGKHLNSLPGLEVTVYKHIGNGNYRLVYHNGSVIKTPSKVRPAASPAADVELIPPSRTAPIDSRFRRLKEDIAAEIAKKKEVADSRKGYEAELEEEQAGLEEEQAGLEEEQAGPVERQSIGEPINNGIVLPGNSPYIAKDQQKSNFATKFIGRGVRGSSTERYRAAYAEKGLANTGEYNDWDDVFVSVNGLRPGRLQFDKRELDLALAANARIITDGSFDRSRTFNIGERELAEYLISKGYSEAKARGGAGLGVWSKTLGVPENEPSSGLGTGIEVEDSEKAKEGQQSSDFIDAALTEEKYRTSSKRPSSSEGVEFDEVSPSPYSSERYAPAAELSNKELNLRLNQANIERPEDTEKLSVSTKIIASGLLGTPAQFYESNFPEIANRSDYTSEDIVFVSTDGGRTDRLGFSRWLVYKATEAGATILTDSRYHRNSDESGAGRDLSVFLRRLGYHDPKGLGIWIKNPRKDSVAFEISREEKEFWKIERILDGQKSNDTAAPYDGDTLGDKVKQEEYDAHEETAEHGVQVEGSIGSPKVNKKTIAPFWNLQDAEAASEAGQGELVAFAKRNPGYPLKKWATTGNGDDRRMAYEPTFRSKNTPKGVINSVLYFLKGVLTKGSTPVVRGPHRMEKIVYLKDKYAPPLWTRKSRRAKEKRRWRRAVYKVLHARELKRMMKRKQRIRVRRAVEIPALLVEKMQALRAEKIQAQNNNYRNSLIARLNSLNGGLKTLRERYLVYKNGTPEQRLELYRKDVGTNYAMNEARLEKIIKGILTSGKEYHIAIKRTKSLLEGLRPEPSTAVKPTPILSFRGRASFLSNFHPIVISYDGIDYPTVEHFFQAMKTTDVAARQRIAAADSPAKAKALGRSLVLRPDWDAVKMSLMTYAIREKFAPGTPLGTELYGTGNRSLVEGNDWGDRFWGVSGGTGENHLGEILMKVRAENMRGYEKFLGISHSPKVPDFPMSYFMPVLGLRPGLRAKYSQGVSTIDLMESGERTSTTRRMTLGNVGDIITFGGRPQQYRITWVGRPDLATAKGRADWQASEGWSLDFVNANPKIKEQVESPAAIQTKFELYTPGDAVTQTTEPTKPVTPERQSRAGSGATALPESDALKRRILTVAKQEVGGAKVEVVYAPDKADVEGWLGDDGTIILNSAAPGMRSEARVRQVAREEHGHALLNTPAGKEAVKRFVGKLTPEQRQSLIDAGYTQQASESNEDYEERLHDEFIAKQGREKTTWWDTLVDNVRAWLSRAGLVNLSNAEVGRMILRQLSAKSSSGSSSVGSGSRAAGGLVTKNGLSPLARASTGRSLFWAKLAKLASPTGGFGAKIRTVLDIGSAVVPSARRRTASLEKAISDALLSEYGVNSLQELPPKTVRLILAEIRRPRPGRLVGSNGKPAVALTKALADSGNALNAMTLRYASSAKGYISEALYNKIISNRSYLTRSYAIFTDPDWLMHVRAELTKGTNPALNKAYDFIAAQINSDTPTATDSDIKTIIFSRLSNYARSNPATGVDVALEGLYGKAHSKMAVGSAWRTLMGEVTDPINVLGISMENVAGKMAYYDTIHGVAQAALEAGLISETGTANQKPEHTFSHSTEGGMRDPLSEYSSDEAFHYLITELRGKASDTTEWMDALLAVTRATKLAQVAGNAGYVAQQLVGNVLALIQLGHFTSILNLPSAVTSELLSRINKGSLDIRDRIHRFMELDVMDDNALNPTVSNRVMDASQGVNLTRQLKGFSKFKMTAEQWIKLLGSIDNAAKFLAMECEIASITEAYKDAPASDKPSTREIEEIAAARIKDRMPSFSRVPLILKHVGDVPMLGNFTTFAYLTGYNLYKNIQYAYKDISNPYMRANGLKSLAGISVVGLMAGGGLAAIMEAVLGGADDEEKRAFLDAKRIKGDPSDYVIYKTSNGEIRGFSLSRLDPLTNYTKAAKSIIKGAAGEDEMYNAALSAMRHVLSPILQQGSIFKTYGDIMDGASGSGKLIYEESDSPSEKLSKSLAYFAKQSFVPVSVNNFFDKMQPSVSAKGQRKSLTADWNMLVAGELTATAPKQLNPPEALKSHLYDFNRAYRDAAATYSKFIKDADPHSQVEADAAYKEFDSKRRAAFLQASMRVNRIINVGGLSPKDIKEVLYYSNTSPREARDLIKGSYRPHKISLETQGYLRRLNKDSGVSNPLPSKARRETRSSHALRQPGPPPMPKVLSWRN